ncbi:Fc receptor-like B [Dasypus novemcinctus]|uniref:Fc receptor-like B n=1 Tax=Dasypus novemcinctus TaxID=9361 RepID=UPI00265D648C|nr:Fc receptor-like B [Dasypus novemcinctus]
MSSLSSNTIFRMSEKSNNISQDSVVSHWRLLCLPLPHPMAPQPHPSAAAADRAIMWTLTALLLLVPSSGQAAPHLDDLFHSAHPPPPAALEKPVLSLHPPWTTIFKGERVTLRCDGYHPLLLELRPISTLWYLGHLLLPSHKKSIEVQTPGVYRCQTRGAPVSDPIHLSVSNDWLILQVPYAAVFEGEPLIMRCRGWYDKVVYKLHYYRDSQAVRYFHSSANYTVPQARASDSGRYQCSGTMRIPVESAPMFSAKVAVTVQELFQAPVLRVMGRVEGRGAAHGGVVVRCDTRLHPQKRDTPLQFAFYKYSRVVRRFDWGTEYTVPEPEVEELESYWCEAATATRSVRKRSPWLQIPGPGSPLDLVSTTAPAPQPAALAPGNKPLSFRKPPVSRSVSSVTSFPNTTLAGLLFPAGSAPTAGPPSCAPPTPLQQSARAQKPDVDLLLREMQLLKGLLSRVVLELKEPQALMRLQGTSETPSSLLAVSRGTPESTLVES